MHIEVRDVIAFMAILASIVSMIVVSRNARKATSVHTENVDLARIRDLRQELKETRQELAETKAEVEQLMLRLQEANAAATAAYREREEMRRYAQMPGMDIETWLRRFAHPTQLNGTLEL
jgi:hypothetical protein